MQEKYTISEVVGIALKYVSIPALLAIGAKIAVQVKQKKATWVGAMVSILTGTSVAYLVTPYIHSNFSEDIHGILIGLAAIMADKIMEYFVFTFKVGVFLDAIFDKILGRYKDNKEEE